VGYQKQRANEYAEDEKGDEHAYKPGPLQPLLEYPALDVRLARVQ